MRGTYCLFVHKGGEKKLHRFVKQSPEGRLRTVLEIERVFRAVRDTQHHLYLRAAQAGMPLLELSAGHSLVLAAMDEQHAVPVDCKKQPRDV